MLKSLQIGLIAGCAALLFGSVAHAATIDYIFTGTCAASSCSLNGTNFTTFTVTEVGSTSSVSGPAGGEYSNATTATFSSGPLTATLTGTNEVLDNTNSPGFVGFAQLPEVSVEATVNSIFETYNLATALSLTTGTPSVASDTYTTSAGNLVFGNITALNFQATVTPLPAALPLFAGGLGLMGLIADRRKRKAKVSA
jgi:hypothetical protein